MLLIVERILILKSVMMFSAVPEEYLSDLAMRCAELHLGEGERFIEEGQYGTSLYVIVSGQVRVHRRGQTITYRGPREVIGELTVLDPHPRSATVEATEPTHILEVAGEDLENLMSESVEVLRAVVRMLSRQVRANTERIANAGWQDEPL